MGTGVILAVSAATTILSGIGQARQSEQIADLQEESAAQTEASNQAEAARSRRENLRRQRVQEAEVEAAGAATGTAGSSANLAIGDTLGAQTAAATAQTGQQLTQIGNQGEIQSGINDAQARAQTFATIGGLASTAFGVAAGTEGGQEVLGDLFS